MRLEKTRELSDGTSVYRIVGTDMEVVPVEFHKFAWYRAVVDWVDDMGVSPESIKVPRRWTLANRAMPTQVEAEQE